MDPAKKWKTSLSLIGILLFFYILSQIDLETLGRHLAQVNLPIVGVTVLLTLPQIYLKALRLKSLLATQKVAYPSSKAFISYMSSIFWGIVTPGRVGEVARVVYLVRDTGVSYGKSILSVFIDRCFDIYVLLLVGYGAIWHFSVLNLRQWQYGLIFFLCLVLPFLVGALTPALNYVARRLKEKFAGSDGVSSAQSQDILANLNQLKISRMAIPLILTLVSYLLLFSQCRMLAMAMDLPVSTVEISLIVGASNLISLIPITLFGIGTRDAALIFFFGIAGLTQEMAVGYSLLIFINFYLITGIICFVGWFFHTGHLTFKQIKDYA
ncbi:MAG: lysylphosphatidylglycerol synthase transmembrane domain-containing protein [Nitrospinales bacterium]